MQYKAVLLHFRGREEKIRTWQLISGRLKGEQEKKQQFIQKCFYHQGQYDSKEDFAKLDKRLTELERKLGAPKSGNRVFCIFTSVNPEIVATSTVIVTTTATDTCTGTAAATATATRTTKAAATFPATRIASRPLLTAEITPSLRRCSFRRRVRCSPPA